jgi:hypothetical protein
VLAGAVPVVVSVVVSVVALVISLLGYDDQHSADQAAAVASRQDYARLVSAWLVYPVGGNYSARLSVQNLGNAPLTDVHVVMAEPESSHHHGIRVSMYLGDIPPCSTLTAQVGPGDVQALSAPLGIHSGAFFLVQVKYLYFRDANGVFWVRHAAGRLQDLADEALSGYEPSTLAPAHRIVSAQGCA